MDTKRSSTPALLAALREGDVVQRQNAAFELWRWEAPRDETTIGALINALRDPNAKVRVYSSKALRVISGRVGGEDTPEAWEDWWEGTGKRLS